MDQNWKTFWVLFCRSLERRFWGIGISVTYVCYLCMAISNRLLKTGSDKMIYWLSFLLRFIMPKNWERLRTELSIRIPYARHYKPRLVYFLPHFKVRFFVFKEVFSENFVLVYGLYSRAACNQERLLMARIRYKIKNLLVFWHYKPKRKEHLQSQ